MPRKSPYVIRLSSAERDEPRRRAAKYTLPYFQVQRAKMILYAAEGLANDEIAQKLDTRREVVSLWRKRFFGGAFGGWKRKPVRVARELFPQKLPGQVQHGRRRHKWHYDSGLARIIECSDRTSTPESNANVAFW
jgi:hypothetical protein